MTETAIRQMFESEAARLRPLLMRIALSITQCEEDAADVVQETLLKLWFLRDRFGEYSCIDAPARVIARNLSLNAVRDRKPPGFFVECSSQLPLEEAPPETGITEEMMLAISRLPDTEQAVLRMKHIDGMETDEIAQMIGSSPGAVRSALSRAREKIRKLFARNAHK